MNINEILLFAKILAYVSGNRSIIVTGTEKKLAASTLKRIADQRYDWTLQQREQYKILVEVVEQLSE